MRRRLESNNNYCSKCGRIWQRCACATVNSTLSPFEQDSQRKARDLAERNRASSQHEATPKTTALANPSTATEDR